MRVAAIERERLLGEAVLRSIQSELLDTRRYLRAGLHPTSQATSEAATDGLTRILDIQPTELHQRTPLVIGSRKDVEFVAEEEGTWIIHCHVLNHVTNDDLEPGGLILAIKVTV